MTTEKDFFAKEGWITIGIAVVITAVAAYLHPTLGFLGFIWFTFCLNFFRNPKRTHDPDKNGILSPADGKVLEIKTAEDPILKTKRQRITIFMSPLNVHVNRAPVTGIVKNIAYHKGKFLAAFNENASAENESNAIHLQGENGTDVTFVQIAGWMARRIINYAKIGDKLERGRIYGMIKFGSRLDVYFPENLEISVKLGQMVKAGETWLALKN